MKDDKLYLIHIRECLERIEAYTRDGKSAFLDDERTQDAVLRNLQTLSESIQRLSATFCDRYPRIPWRDIAAFRNVAVHEYLGIDMERIWDIVESDLPPLRQQIELMMEDLGGPPTSEPRSRG